MIEQVVDLTLAKRIPLFHDAQHYELLVVGRLQISDSLTWAPRTTDFNFPCVFCDDEIEIARFSVGNSNGGSGGCVSDLSRDHWRAFALKNRFQPLH